MTEDERDAFIGGLTLGAGAVLLAEVILFLLMWANGSISITRAR